MAWARDTQLRGETAGAAIISRFSAQDFTANGFDSNQWVQYVSEPLGAAFAGFAVGGAPVYANVRAPGVTRHVDTGCH